MFNCCLLKSMPGRDMPVYDVQCSMLLDNRFLFLFILQFSTIEDFCLHRQFFFWLNFFYNPSAIQLGATSMPFFPILMSFAFIFYQNNS